jgi:hypothetical protein
MHVSSHWAGFQNTMDKCIQMADAWQGRETIRCMQPASLAVPHDPSSSVRGAENAPLERWGFVERGEHLRMRCLRATAPRRRQFALFTSILGGQPDRSGTKMEAAAEPISEASLFYVVLGSCIRLTNSSANKVLRKFFA